MNRRRKEVASPEQWVELGDQAMRMRRAPTTAEGLLWQELRGSKLAGLKFRRQHAIGRFIVDFYCVQAGLIVEVDGPIHQHQRDADRERQVHLESLDLRVIRFTNEAVVSDIDSVLKRIRAAASSTQLDHDAPLSSQGEGPGVR